MKLLKLRKYTLAISLISALLFTDCSNKNKVAKSGWEKIDNDTIMHHSSPNNGKNQDLIDSLKNNATKNKKDYPGKNNEDN